MVVAVLTIPPTWVTVLALLSDGVARPCEVVAELKKPSWVVLEVSFVTPFCVTEELLAPPI
jgi:hypothetical protein